MGSEEIERSFPLLAKENYRLTSDPDFNYNCLAFVLGDHNNWWEPPGEFGFYWPPGFAGDSTIKTAVQIIKLHGYAVEWDKHTEPSSESVAIYAKGEEWTHFAKYTNGRWNSKLGEDHDVAHLSLHVLEGDLYGKVVLVLSKAAK
jgi:hypothetical protein